MINKINKTEWQSQPAGRIPNQLQLGGLLLPFAACLLHSAFYVQVKYGVHIE